MSFQITPNKWRDCQNLRKTEKSINSFFFLNKKSINSYITIPNKFGMLLCFEIQHPDVSLHQTNMYCLSVFTSRKSLNKFQTCIQSTFRLKTRWEHHQSALLIKMTNIFSAFSEDCKTWSIHSTHSLVHVWWYRLLQLLV